jgi:hypothetical protein
MLPCMVISSPLAIIFQVKDLRAKLEKQIQDQEFSMQEVRHLLESAIQEDLIKQLKRTIYETIKGTISKDIKERVQREVLESSEKSTIVSY